MIKNFEEFLNEGSGSLNEQIGGSLYKIGGFIFSDLNAAKKYFDLLSKYTVNSIVGLRKSELQLDEVDPTTLKFIRTLEELNEAQTLVLKKTGSTQYSNDIETSFIDKVSQVMKHFTDEATTNVPKKQAFSGKPMSSVTTVKFPAYANNLQPYDQPSSRELNPSGHFFNTEDAKKVIKFAKDNAIGYFIGQYSDLNPNKSIYQNYNMPIDNIKILEPYYAGSVELDTSDSKFLKLAQSVGFNADDFKRESGDASANQWTGIEEEDIDEWIDSVNAARIQYTEMPKEKMVGRWNSMFEALKYTIDQYKQDAKQRKLGSTEILKEVTNISHVFMNHAATAYPQIVGWSKNEIISPYNDFFISVKCRSGFILPIRLTTSRSGKLVDWSFKVNWLKAQLKRELPDSSHTASYDMNGLMQKITKFTNRI